MSTRTELFALVGVLGLLATSYLLTRHPGHVWHGDPAMYMSHARNMVEGLPYDNTGFIPNPDYYYSPQNYPPLFPLYLTLPYSLWGLDFDGMKLFMIPPILTFLAVFYLSIRRRTGWQVALGLVLVVGLSPLTWRMKDHIAPAYLFCTFLFLVSWLFEKLDAESGVARSNFLLAAAIGIGGYLCFGLRGVGIALLPAIVLYDLVRFRRVRLPSLAACSIMVALIVVQSAFQNTFDDYAVAGVGYLLDDFPIEVLKLVGRNVVRLLTTRSSNFLLGPGDQLPYFIVALTPALFIGLAALGLLPIRDFLFRRARMIDFYVFISLALILILENSSPRYLIPIFPMILVYVTESIRSPLFSRKPRMAAIAFGVTLTVLGLSYTAYHAGLVRKPEGLGMLEEPLLETLEFVRAELPANDVCVFRLPRLVSLLTDHPAAAPHKGEPEELRDFFQKIDARCIIVRKSEPRESLTDFVSEYSSELDLAYENVNYSVYTVQFRDG